MGSQPTQTQQSSGTQVIQPNPNAANLANNISNFGSSIYDAGYGGVAPINDTLTRGFNFSEGLHNFFAPQATLPWQQAMFGSFQGPNSTFGDPLSMLRNVPGPADFNPQIEEQRGNISNISNDPWNTVSQGMMQNYRDLFGQTQNQNYQPFYDIGNNAFGQNNDVVSRMLSLQNQAGGTTPEEQFLTSFARGDVQDNPYLNQLLDVSARRTGNQLASYYAGAGRLGSFGSDAGIARGITEAVTPALFNAGEAAMNRRFQAPGIIGGAQRAGQGLAAQIGAQTAGIRQADTGLGLSAYGKGADLYNQNIINALNSLQGEAGANNMNVTNRLNATLANMGVLQGDRASTIQAATGIGDMLNRGYNTQQSWANMLPTMGSLAYMPALQDLAIGGVQQQGQQDLMNAPWTRLQPYANLATSLAGLYGTPGTVNTTGNTITNQSTPWTQIAGLGLAGLGTTFGQRGVFPGGAGFSSMFSSDETLKTDIRKVGVDPATDLNIYTYRYKGDPKNYPKVTGPMAQEVEEMYPGSTARFGGKLAVTDPWLVARYT